MDIANKKLFKQQCFIDGEWINSEKNETINVNNPATNEIIGNVPNCGKQETTKAILAAEKSWKEWKSKTSKEPQQTMFDIEETRNTDNGSFFSCFS